MRPQSGHGISSGRGSGGLSTSICILTRCRAADACSFCALRYLFLTQPGSNRSGSPSPQPLGYLTLTLHAHLPYVVHHGTWPHGMEWLLEAAAETYLPLLEMLGRLERDGIRFHANLNLSPVLLEQLAHPSFRAEFPRYAERKITAAREDEAFFLQSNEAHYAELARMWQSFFQQALDSFHALGGDLIARFRHFHQSGLVHILTCPATHPYLPLVGTDEAIRAQLQTALQVYEQHFGTRPRGVWSPECGYRPAGVWAFPMPNADGSPRPAPAPRMGVEQAFAEAGLEFFFVDTHLVESSSRTRSPYEQAASPIVPNPQLAEIACGPNRPLHQPYLVTGSYGDQTPPLKPVAVFPRDPRTGLQVWSGDSGYPADFHYLDFHKKRWPGGHRYWSITGAQIDMADKQPYQPQAAAERIRSHADHFVHIVWQSLHTGFDEALPPILAAPFDAELFGHWWFEGVAWLEAVARTMQQSQTGIQMLSAAEYLDRYPAAGTIAMQEGSWGVHGNHQVWLNPDTSWTYSHLYPAERLVRQACTLFTSMEPPQDLVLARRILQQLCRELLLLQSSDWQFLITTGSARDYAELRFVTHRDYLHLIHTIWQSFLAENCITPEQDARLAEIEQRDSLFASVDPAAWAGPEH
ncbi:MAG: DUF1957 domain-containing protein [Acidobacteriota bacterium]|nr:DUF1957 domain-containing protein [Acidobacteriota bacterium]